MSEICVHGKIVLFGEHAVVYGRSALAVGIPNGVVVVSLEPTAGCVRMRVQPWGLDESDCSDNLVGEELRRLRRVVPGGQCGCDVVFKTQLPPGAGMGSSAALAVALVRSLAQIRQIEVSHEEVRRMAHELEKVFHGQPSGLDDTVAAYGGLCLFRRYGWEDSLKREFTFDSINPQALRVLWRVPALAVGNSGVERITYKMVAKVKRQWEQNRRWVETLFDDVDQCLDDGLAALRDSDIAGLGDAMSRNQQVLGRLGLSCPEIEEMVALASKAGATGAKLTGAGGGGGVIAVAADRQDEIIEAWRSHGFSAWKVAFA